MRRAAARRGGPPYAQDLPRLRRQVAERDRGDEPPDRAPAGHPRDLGQEPARRRGHRPAAAHEPHEVAAVRRPLEPVEEDAATECVERGKVGRHVLLADAQHPPDLPEFAVQAPQRIGGERPGEVEPGIRDRLEHGRPDPGVGLGVERRIAPALRVGARELAVQPAQPRGLRDRRGSAVDRGDHRLARTRARPHGSAMKFEKSDSPAPTTGCMASSSAARGSSSTARRSPYSATTASRAPAGSAAPRRRPVLRPSRLSSRPP